MAQSEMADIFVIGGGVNGCGIARDAAGRGLSVVLAEKDDLASGTSSASTKLFHGGLRYLEYFELRLVREALKEREVLLGAMPHISWPMRFVLPLSKEMRFEQDTPSAKLLNTLMPWMKGRRPDWLIRLGLFLYDHMGGRKLLPATRSFALHGTEEGAVLDPRFARAFEYSDVWVDDARLVALNARDADARGAEILTRAEVIEARRASDHWQISLRFADGSEETRRAKALVNAAGPWVAQMLERTEGTDMQGQIRLVRGSHIITRRLFEHDKAYFLQGSDGRICFMIPYERDFTLIGTTDAEHGAPDTKPEISAAEQSYLLSFVNGYLRTPISEADIVSSYAGVRPLQDDGQASASAATRDYELRLDAEGAPLLTVFGGKITTYRKLSEAAVDKLAPESQAWTRGAPLAGGGFAPMDAQALRTALCKDYSFLSAGDAERLFKAYGLEARVLLGKAKSWGDLGQHFGAGLSEAEVNWMIKHEFAQTAEDILWRRSKLGLYVSPEEIAALEAFLAAR